MSNIFTMIREPPMGLPKSLIMIYPKNKDKKKVSAHNPVEIPHNFYKI